MKKVAAVIGMALIFMVIVCQTSNAQSFTRLEQGRAQDTIHKSTLILTSAVNINTNDLQSLSLQVSTDSISGTPDTKYVLQRSVDGVHYYSIAGDTLAPTYIGVNAVHPTSSKTLNVNPFYGTYARVAVYTGSGTQKSKMWVAIKTCTIR